jgi:trigger factor
MNVEVEQLPNCLASIRVELPPERVKQEWSEIAKGFRQAARIPGFRPGKAPQNVVEAKYRKEIQEELTRKLVQETTREAIKEKGLRVLSISNVDDVEFTPERSMRFTATLITTPEFELPEYKGIQVKSPPADVTPEEVDSALDRLRERHATFSELEGQPLEIGSFAVIDFTTTVDGQPLAQAFPDAPKMLGGNNDFWIRAEDDILLPGFGPSLMGMQIGEIREFDLPVPDKFPTASLAGKLIHFRVTLKALKKMDLPELNDEFASQVGEGLTVGKLRDLVGARLQEERTKAINAQKRSQIVDYLVKNVECELPQTYVRDETRRIMSEIVEHNQQRGVSEELLRESGKEIVDTASRSAKDRLKASFILTRIGEKEKIEVTASDLKQRVAELATQYRMTFEKAMSELDRKGAIPQIAEEIQIGKVLDFLTSNANVEHSSETA